MTAFGIERDLEQDVRRMADLTMAAASAWSDGDTRRSKRAVGGIIGATTSPYDRAAFGWAVTSILHERLSIAWEGYWQPVDMDRLVARTLKRPERDLLGDAMVHHLTQFAPSTVDPEWREQLEALGARVWWPAHQSYLEARGEDEDWHALVTSSARLIATIWHVPQIERIGPRPGEAAPESGSARVRDVDPRILERVRRLLAKAESTTYEAEADTFTAGAQSLMARHSIDAAVLAATEAGSAASGPGARRLGVDNPYEMQKVVLLDKVADANRCRTVWSRDLGFVTLIGHREDQVAVETLFTSLLIQATSTMTKQGSRTDRAGRSRTTAFRRSFLAAYAVRIGERLREATESEVRTMSEELGATAGNGRELVPLLEERRAAVDDAVDEMFPALTTRRGPSVTDAEGWDSGTAAADRASLSGAEAVEG
ncbi:DUF2786 domain-containing protein [Janibacter cremeus]|uniref:DUF2786 domain-containing protein n=1 Tax=Janibacter cremeus TaxID=1285192 RepID=UPI0023FA2027|nr:DUF2786 domain-containing protein [Janibacter cremeus]WEV77114.1 DUF2786 domain-containing protein [Janibacter cremeus]